MELNELYTTKNGVGIYKTRLEALVSKQRLKGIALRALFGFLMGISDGIPGYSGSTTLTIFGFYPKFIQHARMFFGINKFRRAMRSLLWLFPFGVMWLVAALLYARFVTWFSNFGFNVNTGVFSTYPFTGQLILFLTFVIISFSALPIFFYFHKKVLFCNSLKEYKKPKNFALIIVFFLGFAAIIAVGLYIHFCVHTMIGGHNYSGFLLTNAGKDKFPTALYGKLAYVALISGFLLFLPGVSSSLVMLLFGMYSYTYTIIHDHPLLNIIPILITVVCVLTGIICNIFLTNFLLRKFPKFFYNFAAGIITGAFITILLAISPALYAQCYLPMNIVLIVLAVCVVCMINGYIFFNLYKQNKKDPISFGII